MTSPTATGLAAAAAAAASNSTDPELEFDREVYPIGVSLTEVSIIGAPPCCARSCAAMLARMHVDAVLSCATMLCSQGMQLLVGLPLLAQTTHTHRLAGCPTAFSARLQAPLPNAAGVMQRVVRSPVYCLLCHPTKDSLHCNASMQA
jgi:hypothetical protein